MLLIERKKVDMCELYRKIKNCIRLKDRWFKQADISSS